MSEIRPGKPILFKTTFFKYAVIAVLPLAVLLFQPAVSFTVLAFGERVLLKTRPIDPRDFLRGDYVTLDYEISDLPDQTLKQLQQVPEEREYRLKRKTVYVTLKLDGEGVGSLSGASSYRPSGGLYLRGQIGAGRSRTVDYGLGVYYVPEGTGHDLERAMRDGTVLADVRVLRGRGVIKKLEVKRAR
ncbi:MAG: GDYXXLXY domain-containing protein [Synergistaceae bacterium]|jgi:uncharacterized membrane-anchored protein|nr:GDYXXLXY domain-containing protein [Synergistaceae bacterium]